MLSDRCLSVCLSVTFVHCGQTVGRIKMKLGMHVGLGPGHIVATMWPQAPHPQRGTAPQFSAHICCGQMAASPPQKGGGAPKFSVHVYCGQTVGWIKMPLGTKVGLSPGDYVLDVDPAPALHTKGVEPPP